MPRVHSPYTNGGPTSNFWVVLNYDCVPKILLQKTCEKKSCKYKTPDPVQCITKEKKIYQIPH